MAFIGIVKTFGIWLLFFPALCGWGNLLLRAVTRATRGRVATRSDLFGAFWLGCAAVLGGLEMWHLFCRVDALATACFLVVGYAGCALFLKTPRPLRAAVPGKVGLFLAIPVLVWIAHLAIQGPANPDSGLYHFSAVRWAKEFPIVPGLGNLHGRLAFNQSYFLFVALLDGVLAGQGYHFATSLLAAVLVLQLFTAAHALLTPPSFRPDRLAAFVLLPIVLYEMRGPAQYSDLSTPSPDLPVFILGAVLFLRLLGQLFPDESDAATPATDVLVIATLSAAAVTFKLTFLAAGLAFTAVSCLVARLREWKTAAALLSPAAVLLAAWMLRGAMTSGYPAYPSTFGALPVDWRVPTADTAEMARIIAAWARMPRAPVRETLESWAWLGPWSARVWQMESVRIFVALLGTSTLLLGVAAGLGQARKSAGARWLWVAVPAVAALAFWMVTAPEPRFAGAMPWMIALTPLLLAASWLDAAQFQRALAVLAPVVALAVGLVLAIPADRVKWKLHDGFARLPKCEIETHQTASGLTVYVPVRNGEIWNARLPSAPGADPRLQMRGAKLGDGFRIAPGE